jgi:hypothetical protein
VLAALPPAEPGPILSKHTQPTIIHIVLPARPHSTLRRTTRHPRPQHPAPHVFLCQFAAAMADHADPNGSGKKDAPLRSIVNATSPRSTPAPLQMGSSPHSGHRSSFAENMRALPHSPRASRQPSLSQQAFQDLLNNPPTKGGDSKFAGRDWRSVQVGEVVDEKQVRFAELDTSVEEATNVSRQRHGAMQLCMSYHRACFIGSTPDSCVRARTSAD